MEFARTTQRVYVTWRQTTFSLVFLEPASRSSLSLSLSPSIQREFSVSRRAYKTSERFQNFNVALSPVAVMRIIANNFD